MLSPDPLDCSDFGHSWEKTGRIDHHAFTVDRHGCPVQRVIFVRCKKCGQDGFRNRASRVIYTWRNE